MFIAVPCQGNPLTSSSRRNRSSTLRDVDPRSCKNLRLRCADRLDRELFRGWPAAGPAFDDIPTFVVKFKLPPVRSVRMQPTVHFSDMEAARTQEKLRSVFKRAVNKLKVSRWVPTPLRGAIVQTSPFLPFQTGRNGNYGALRIRFVHRWAIEGERIRKPR